MSNAEGLSTKTHNEYQEKEKNKQQLKDEVRESSVHDRSGSGRSTATTLRPTLRGDSHYSISLWPEVPDVTMVAFT